MGEPLDKKTADFYGQFVQAAYAMYENPQSADPLRPAPSGIPAGYELGAWIHMSDFVFDISDPKFYGIVAHKTDDPGSRIVAIRGTENAMEWIDDAAALLVPFRQVPSAGRVAFGFDKIYSSLRVVKYVPPGEQGTATPAVAYGGSFAEQLEQLALSREREFGLKAEVSGSRPRRPTVVTGHSLGSALATLFVMENDDKGKFDVSALCTFASPRVGNMEFVHHFNRLGIISWRIVNTRDVVPKVPPSVPIFLDYAHVDDAYPFDSAGFAKNSLSCWHSMDTYLHWLDPAHAVRESCVPTA